MSKLRMRILSKEFIGLDVWGDQPSHEPGFCAVYRVTTADDKKLTVVDSVERGPAIYLNKASLDVTAMVKAYAMLERRLRVVAEYRPAKRTRKE